MLDALMNLFGKKEPSGKIARDRLNVVLIHDRASVSPETMRKIQDEILQVISKYMEINKQDMKIDLETDANSVALVANIPVNHFRHGK